MIKMLFIILSFVVSKTLLAWPGDQASLACLKSERESIENQFNSKGGFATNGKTKEENRQIAIDRVKTIVRNNHDRDFTVTKLGDSLSDLVDFYGVATPRKLFPNYGDAAGTFGGNPLYMDSWNDYMSAGAGISSTNGFKFQNFGKSGNTTLGTMQILGIDINGDRENWTVAEDATRCVKTRPKTNGAFVIEPTDGIFKEQSSMRSTLLINGNDIIQSGIGFNGWLPFLNKYQVDSSLINIMAITDSKNANNVKNLRFTTGL